MLGVWEAYIFPQKLFKKWNKILEFGCVLGFEMLFFLHKNNVMSQPALAMALGGICILEIFFLENDAIYGEFGCIF